MKKVIAISTLLMSFILVGCQDTSIDKDTGKAVYITSAEYPHYENIESLEETASEVVKAEVIDERVEELNALLEDQSGDEYSNPGGNPEPSYYIFTIHTLRVKEVYKGDVEVGEVIEIKQFGGETEDAIDIHEDQLPFSSNTDYVLFLESYNEDTPSTLLNQEQSAYIYEKSLAKSGKGELQSVNERNDLTLTLEDVKRISEKNN